jgi:hypothetical protein
VTAEGRRVVSGSFDKTVRVWDIESGICLRILDEHTSEVACVSVTPDGRLVVSASWDKTVRVWNIETGSCLWVLEGHSDKVRSVTVTPDGRHAISGSWDQTLRVWDLHKGACMMVFHASTQVSDSDAFSEKLVIGLQTGELLFAEMRNVPMGPAIITALNFQQARCTMCGKEFVPPPTVVAAIRNRDAMQLSSNCPHCSHALKFNPFFASRED